MEKGLFSDYSHQTSISIYVTNYYDYYLKSD